MARFALSFLGPVLITRDGCSLEAPFWAKTIALLSYLALESDRPHRREALAGLLWPEQPDTAARNSLRQALHQLRQSLGDEVLHVTAQSIQFHPNQDVLVDVGAFETLLQECRRHFHRRPDGCPDCVERLERAVALYRGDLLAELSIKDSIAFEEWAVLRREQLRRQAIEALDSLAAHYARRGDYARMEQAGRRQIELDPLREPAHRQVLQALAWSGRPTAARAHYARLVALLDRELGSPPEEKTTALIEQIAAGSLPPPAGVVLRQWPAPLPPLVGREEELAQLSEWLQAPEPRLVTVVGAGGVGKTRLALEAAAREAVAFSDGACFVSLDVVADPELIVPAIAAALHISLAGSSPPAEQLAQALGERDLLLVLDNCEHLLEGTIVFASLLAACPHLEILATSREPLRLRAEQLLPLEPLSLPDLETQGAAATLVETIARSAAVALFCQRARAVRPRFSLDDETALPVAQVCVHLDGLPLAIELAAAWMQTLSPAQILARLEKRLVPLVDGARDLPPRQRTLRAALDWSYELLKEEEKQLLARLSVFAGGGTPEAVRAVCLEAMPAGEASEPAAAAALRIKNLLKRREIRGQARYVLLETIREYAQEQLAKRGELEELRERHAAYYLGLAEREGARLLVSPPPSVIELLEAEHNNLRAALRWALEQQEERAALRLVGALWRFWHLHNDYQEGLRWSEAALQLALPGAPDSPEWNATLPLRIEALTGAGAIACAIQQDLGTAMAHLEEAALLARQSESVALPRILALIGRAADSLGDTGRALGAYTEGLALARAGGPERRPSVAYILNALGNILSIQEDYAGARAHYEEALVMWRDLGDANGTICGLCNLGTLAYRSRDLPLALRTLREGLHLAWGKHDTRHAAYSLFALAATYQALGNPVRAARLLGQSEALYRSLGMTPGAHDQALYETTAAAIQGALGDAAFARERERGQTIPAKEGVAEALEEEIVSAPYQ